MNHVCRNNPAQHKNFYNKDKQKKPGNSVNYNKHPPIYIPHDILRYYYTPEIDFFKVFIKKRTRNARGGTGISGLVSFVYLELFLEAPFGVNVKHVGHQ
jgi:hypothetical protein